MDVGDLQTAEIRIPLLSDPSPKELWTIILKITLKNTIVKAKVRIGYTDFLRIVQTDSWRSIVINRLSTSSEVAYNCNQEKAGPLTIYEGMVLRGNLHHDANQHKVAVALDELLGQMREHELQMISYHVRLWRWTEDRREVKQKLLQEEATVAT
ncbi:hypothetical protein BDL97_16G102200 [Sphagnum fallax]|uniref:Uncharacterized protein n=1 Tax=Sphagnum jensenii TaxID=128206 RepID=A0ABP0WCM6_9BRYO|nr:hypothetical protein BDL97_16G102200 [Sphagnum fallax]